MRACLFLLLLANTAFAQTDSTQLPEKKPVALLRPFEYATVWEGVRIKTEQVFEEQGVEPSFKIKSDKEKRKALVEALEGQFQVNIAEHEVRSLKRARDLAECIFRAQQGIAMFSKANFQGKVERFVTDRKTCKEDADCLNFIGALIVPKGLVVTLYNQANFKGAQLKIDASRAEVRINSLLRIDFSDAVSTTDKAANWREAVHSLRVTGLEKK